jgi:ABC-type branched-subunit amino acid transport system ATPase component
VIKSFGAVTAVNQVSLELRSGTITGLIGPNGSGKSTLLNIISGLCRPDAGRVYRHGMEVTRWPAWRTARTGVVRTLQHPALIPTLTLLENVQLGLHRRSRTHLLTAILGISRGETQATCLAKAALAGVGLEALSECRPAQTPLSAGQVKLAVLAQALVSGPDVLLLDEIMTNLSSSTRAIVTDLLCDLRRQGAAILLVEHDIPLVRDLCDRLVVLDHGVKIADGEPSTVLRERRVVEAYVGSARLHRAT